MWAIHSTYSIAYADGYSVSTSIVAKKRRRVASSTARTTGVETRVTPIYGGGYERGQHKYTEKEFQDIFNLGLEVKSLKKKWQSKRNDVRKVMVKCERDLDNFTKEENREITALIEGIPLNSLGLQIEEDNSDSLI